MLLLYVQHRRSGRHVTLCGAARLQFMYSLPTSSMSRTTLTSIIAIVAVVIIAIIAMQAWNPDIWDGMNGGSQSSSAMSSAMSDDSMLPSSSSSSADTDVRIDQMYGNTIVYTTDMSADEAMLRQDCSMRGGTFDSCGSPCAPDAEVCIEVCAYTCTVSAE